MKWGGTVRYRKVIVQCTCMVWYSTVCYGMVCVCFGLFSFICYYLVSLVSFVLLPDGVIPAEGGLQSFPGDITRSELV